MRIVIPLQPVTKKNSQRIVVVRGRPMVLPSKKYTEYQKACALFMPKMEKPIDFGVNVKALFYNETHRRRDLVNDLESVLDVLVHYSILADDNYLIVWSMDGSRELYDKEHPRTEIEITKVGENEWQT